MLLFPGTPIDVGADRHYVCIAEKVIPLISHPIHEPFVQPPLDVGVLWGIGEVHMLSRIGLESVELVQVMWTPVVLKCVVRMPRSLNWRPW